MLAAHLVPGYFAAMWSQAEWNPQWTRKQRIALWAAALASTAAPDLDVVYNTVFRGFIGHTIVWTHGIFPYLGLALVSWLIGQSGRGLYVRTFIGLVALGGLSHVLLDAIAHGTTVFYPLSSQMFGSSSVRELEKGLWPYLTDPIFLLEPLLITLALAHWIAYRLQAARESKKVALVALVLAWIGFSATYLLLLPRLQHFEDPFPSKKAELNAVTAMAILPAVSFHLVKASGNHCQPKE